MRPRSGALRIAEQFYRICKAADERALESYEITLRELEVLRTVTRGTSAVPAVAASLGISTASGVALVERLESRGLVVRTRTRGRRIFVIEITIEGKKILAKHESLDNMVEKELQDRYGDAVLIVLAQVRGVIEAEAAPEIVVSKNGSSNGAVTA